MGDLTVKPASGGKLDLRNNGGTAKIEVNDGADIAVTTGSASGDDFKVNTNKLVVAGNTGNVSMSNDLTVTGEVSMTTLDIGGTNVTATATELNYVDGVTASIQRQLNSIKANAISLMNIF